MTAFRFLALGALVCLSACGDAMGTSRGSDGSTALSDGGDSSMEMNLQDAGATPRDGGSTPMTPTDGGPQMPPGPQAKGFFASASVEEFNTVRVPGQGDLWPSCWSDDDALYAANGDGTGIFQTPINPPPYDIRVSRLQGKPETGITGVALAQKNISQIWNGGYNRKPTGMVCVDGKLYLAVQDLSLDFNRAPSATIVMSADKGATWTWNTSAPMFPNGVLTTLFFLDYGKNNANAKDGFVYVYGLDNNWRDSFNNVVPDPTQLWLLRVPKGAIQDRGQWTYFAGTDAGGAPKWSSNIADRKPVIEDTRRIYTAPIGAQQRDMTVLSQGSVTYNAPLNRYIYASWTEFTFEFYESPTPWGPWKLFHTKDYGAYPWFADKHGGYATTIPSKYISADGKTMWVVNSTFMGGFIDYSFSLRKLTVQPFAFTDASNARSAASLTGPNSGAVPEVKSFHYGRVGQMNNGVVGAETEDSWNGEAKTEDWWGYTFPRSLNLNKLVYATGASFPDGGWFKTLRVEVRRNFTWTPVTDLVATPAYPLDASAGNHRTFTFKFKDTVGDGIRIIGAPGGPAAFTTLSELNAFYE